MHTAFDPEILRKWIFLAAVCSLTPCPAHAGEAFAAGDTIYVMPTIQVEGRPVERFAEGSRRSLASSVIRTADSPHRLPAARMLLRGLPGLELRRYGGLGAFSNASLRGSGGQELAVYLDGVDLRHPMSGDLNLDDLPLAGVERIEVYRGAVPGELGGGAPAGAIHLVSDGRAARRLSLSAGSYGTTRLGVSSRGGGPWGLKASISGSLLSSQSDFHYLDRHGTQLNSADDTLRVRHNADIRAGDLMLSVKRPSRAGDWDLSYRWLLRDTGIPGTETLPTYHTRSVRRGQDLRLGWRGPIFGPNLRLEAQAWGRDGVTEFVNPESETGHFLAGDETRDRLLSLGIQLRADLFQPPYHALLRAERRGDRFRPDNLNPAKNEDYERRRAGLNWTGELRRETRRLLLVAAYGEERLRDNYYGPPALPWLPPVEKPEHDIHVSFRRAGLRWRLIDGDRDGLELFGNFSKGYRAPSLLELFGQDVSVQGNLELIPERGLGGDIGLALRTRRGGWMVRAELSLFRREMREQILFLRNSQYWVKAQNVESSRLSGSEFSLMLDWRRWSLSLADTRLETRDKSGHSDYDGKALPYRTPRRLFARLSWRTGPLSFFGEIEDRAAVYTDRYNDPARKLPAVRFLGAGLRTRLARGWSFSLEGMNLNDERADDVLGFPLPGRSWIASIEWMGENEMRTAP